MKLFAVFVLLLSSVALATPADHGFEAVSMHRLDNDDLEYYRDTGGEDKLFAEAMARLTDDSIQDDEGIIDDTTERAFKHLPRRPHKKRPRKRRPRLRVQLKVFRRSSGGATYKYYMLQGRVIRHYRVRFSTSQQFRFRKSAQRKTRRCLIRRFTRKCIRLPFFVQGFCTTVIAKRCSGEFESFEIANPKTRGKNKVKPGKPRRPERPPRDPVSPPEDPVVETPEPELF